MTAGTDPIPDASLALTDTRERRRTLAVEWLGRMPYACALERQAQYVAERRAGRIDDRLLLLEHPHVITLGTSARDRHILLDPVQLADRGIEVHHAGRGGDVTYHGPGQLVGYPILDLKPDRCDLHRYVRDIEEALIRALGDLDIGAHRIDGRTGVWTESGKVAAIGVRVASGWITSHGFALNVSTDLAYFDAIVPCGIAGGAVTSIERILRRPIEASLVRGRVTRRFAEVFGRTPRAASDP